MAGVELDPDLAGYGPWLASLKQRVRSAQLRAHRAANTELIELSWDIGRDIVERQVEQRWGTGVVRRLAADLRGEFPDMTGLSFNKPEVHANVRRVLA